LSSGAVALLALCAVLLLLLPRRWAPLPLIAGACYLGFGQGLELGPFSLTTSRILIAAGVVRVLVRMERLPGGFIAMDRVMILWGVWTCISSQFHDDPKGDLIFKLGTVFNAGGFYFLIRTFCASFNDLLRICRITAIVLLPVMVGMLSEQILFRNPFAAIAPVPETPMVRDGRIRSFGAFTHPILAGTVGAVCLPLMAGLWRHSRSASVLGTAVCLAVVISSGSSGPVMSAVAAIAALCLWPYRSWMGALRWAAVAAYIVLDLVMKVPAYYIIARLDVTGSSTGWHRARLIESSINHLHEWWMTGTDYTRHWMPSGVSWNPRHTDITNHYLQMGVEGGLLQMFLFIALIVIGFIYIGRLTGTSRGTGNDRKFLFWAFGSALFAHATTCISVSYFDQSILFLYLTLAVIGSASQVACRVAVPKPSRATSRFAGQSKFAVEALAKRESGVNA
jgi:hypothetical protein